MAVASKKKSLLIFVVLLIVVSAAAYAFIHRNEEDTDDASIEAHIITIAPKVGGYVKAVYINDNQQVKAGDVLVEIDPADYIFRRDRALAALAAAKASHSASNRTLETTRVSAPSNLEAARAQVDSAQATWVKASHDLKRMQHLNDEARSRQQLDSAIAAEKTAFSALQDAKAKLRSAETAPQVIESAQSNAEVQAAQIKQAQADLDQAEKDLTDTKLIAPIDGRVTKRGVEPGDFVQPGQQLTYLVGNDRWVVADFKETQLKNMHIGDKADIHIDAYPNAKIEGKVDSIQPGTGVRFSAFPPENATGNFIKIVQRVPVKIVLTKQPDPNLSIGPGMSVEPTVYTK
jgi:membrane fusion protein (multidrug efflux system)